MGMNSVITDNPEWFMSCSTNVCNKTVKSNYLHYAYFQMYEFILKVSIVFVEPLPCPFSFTPKSLNNAVAESNRSDWPYQIPCRTSKQWTNACVFSVEDVISHRLTSLRNVNDCQPLSSMININHGHAHNCYEPVFAMFKMFTKRILESTFTSYGYPLSKKDCLKLNPYSPAMVILLFNPY